MKIYSRAKDCYVFVKELARKKSCDRCEKLELKEVKERVKKEKIINAPAKRNAPLSKTHRHRVELALKVERAAHKTDIERMQKEIENASIPLQNEGLNTDFFEIMENNKNVTPFMKLFWQQQKQVAQGNPKAIRYHPMILRFCISLAAKSSSAYDELRATNILTLPCRRTLRDYSNHVKPSTGFNPQVTEELIKTSSHLQGYQRFVCLSFDEIKIQEKLVFDKYTGDLVGFVDLGDPEMNFSTFEDTNKLASYVMVYYIRGLASDLKFSFAYFGTDGMNAYQIMTTFWDAVSILEMTCKLPVICAVSNGTSSNRKFYKMHGFMDDALSEVVYRSINLFAEESRYLYFLQMHLIL